MEGGRQRGRRRTRGEEGSEHEAMFRTWLNRSDPRGSEAFPYNIDAPRVDHLCLLTMPITTAIYSAQPHKINSLLADIEQQFSLDQDALIAITSHFHKLFNLGLREYGHPMAMMYALARAPLLPLTSKPQPHVRYRRAGRYRNRVLALFTLTLLCSHRMIARSWHLISAEPTCNCPCIVALCSARAH